MNAREDNEMIERPMKNARRAELCEIRQLKPQGARGKTERSGNLREVVERGALEGDGIAAPERIQINAVAMKVQDHG